MSLTPNPMGTDGLEFIEFSSPSPKALADYFEQLGFTAIAKHRSKQVTLFRQGKINFILNEEPHSFAFEFAKLHGPSMCAIAFRVKNANDALERAIALGAKPFLDGNIGKGELMIPAIFGVGGKLIYFVDQYQDKTIYETDFIPLKGVHPFPEGQGLLDIDHLQESLLFNETPEEAIDFYAKIFNFTHLKQTQHAYSSPCGKIRITYQQHPHIALNTNDIHHIVEILKLSGLPFLNVPKEYYDMIDVRIKNHHENIERLQKNGILIDGQIEEDKIELLLHLFTPPSIGPFSLELIQRKGNEGFAED